VPLSQDELLENARKAGNPNPEANGEWIKIAENYRDGDKLRLVNCSGVKGVGDTVYYALFREDKVILKFHSMTYD